MSDEARKGKSIGHVTNVPCVGGPHAGTTLAMHSLASAPAVPERVPVNIADGVYVLVRRPEGPRYVWEPAGTASVAPQRPVAPVEPGRRGGPSPAARAALARLGADPDSPTERSVA